MWLVLQNGGFPLLKNKYTIHGPVKNKKVIEAHVYLLDNILGQSSTRTVGIDSNFQET